MDAATDPRPEPAPYSDAERSAMPGLTAPVFEISDHDALLLAMLVGRLKRAVTDPGSGDRAFIRDISKFSPHALTAKQRAHVMRLAWRYKFQLPDWLRPGSDPDLAPENQPHTATRTS